MRKMLMAGTALILALAPATASTKAIYTGGQAGAYHSLFCPPIPGALEAAQFPGYQCTPSAGTLDNIKRVLESPTSIGFAQLDVYAKEAAARPDDFKKLVVIRQLACEGLWIVTKNPRISSYGQVLGLAKRLPFIVPPAGSGAAASFDFLRSIDPEGLGRASNVRPVKDATTVINTVAASTDGSVGFFVQFADPDNANIKLMLEKGLKAIPVMSREIVRTKVGDQEVYQVQTFQLENGFFSSKSATTACTPVVIFTGTPESQTGRNDIENQQDLIKEVRSLSDADFLPKEGRVASLIKGAKRLAGKGLDEALGAVEAARKAIQE